MVRKLLSKGECRDVAGVMRPDYETGILLSSEEIRELLGRIVGKGASSLRRSG